MFQLTSWFSRMKKSVFIVNTARGGIINEVDLARGVDLWADRSRRA